MYVRVWVGVGDREIMKDVSFLLLLCVYLKEDSGHCGGLSNVCESTSETGLKGCTSLLFPPSFPFFLLRLKEEEYEKNEKGSTSTLQTTRPYQTPPQQIAMSQAALKGINRA